MGATTMLKRFVSELEQKRAEMAGKVDDVENALLDFSFYEVVGFLIQCSSHSKRFNVLSAVFNENNVFVEKIVVSVPHSRNHIVLKHLPNYHWNVVFEVSDPEIAWMKRFCELFTAEDVPEKKEEPMPKVLGTD